jgi:hypothetical protein
MYAVVVMMTDGEKAVLHLTKLATEQRQPDMCGVQADGGTSYN